MPILPKLIYTFNEILIKILSKFFYTIKLTYSKIYTEKPKLKWLKLSWLKLMTKRIINWNESFYQILRLKNAVCKYGNGKGIDT